MLRRASAGLFSAQRSLSRALETASKVQETALPLDSCTNLKGLVPSPFAKIYKNALEENVMNLDDAQFAAASVLSRVSAEVQPYLNDAETSGLSWFSRIMGRYAAPKNVPRGAYLWSTSPGTGKTMLTNMMYDAVEGSCGKRRDHFHSFALDVHSRLHLQQNSCNPADKLGNVAREMASEFKLLVLDEFQVTDISEAVIVHQLFRRLFAHGVVLVATSNRAPEQLYTNGIQRELFLPLIPLLHERCHVHEMGVTIDYRLRHSGERSTVYFIADKGETSYFDKKLEELRNGFPFVEDRLAVVGRTLSLPMAVPQKRVALFTFEDLFERPLSSADYIALCCSYHTIFVRGIPVLHVITDRNAVRRFTNFIDCAYEARVKLVILAEAGAKMLLRGIGNNDAPTTEEAFASKRTISRLLEMQCSAYLSQPWAPTMAVRM